MATQPHNDALNAPAVQPATMADNSRGIALTGQWTTLSLVRRVAALKGELVRHSAGADLSLSLIHI